MCPKSEAIAKHLGHNCTDTALTMHSLFTNISFTQLHWLAPLMLTIGLGIEISRIEKCRAKRESWAGRTSQVSNRQYSWTIKALATVVQSKLAVWWALAVETSLTLECHDWSLVLSVGFEWLSMLSIWAYICRSVAIAERCQR